jgi:hypothetical protein
MPGVHATVGVPEEAKELAWRQQAIKRLAEPEDIVGPIAFLASEEAGFTIGQALVVDSGLYKISNEAKRHCIDGRLNRGGARSDGLPPRAAKAAACSDTVWAGPPSRTWLIAVPVTGSSLADRRK